MKTIWSWLRWVLLGITLLIIGGIIFILIVKPSSEDLKVISIQPFEDPRCTRDFLPKFNSEPYYKGELFDTHFHIPPTYRSNFDRNGILGEDVNLTEIICKFEKENVTGAIAFYAPNFWAKASLLSDEEIYNRWIEQGKQIKAGLPNWVHLMLIPGIMNAEDTLKVYDAIPETYEGFGEIVYFAGESPRSDSQVDDEISLGIEKIANERKQIVMVHPDEKDKSNLENALSKNPNAIFLLHGWDHDDYIMQLMYKYPNIYFTLDAATLYPERGKIEGPENEFTEEFTKNFNANLNRAVDKWKIQIERNPDRFMWGTDRSIGFHYSEEMSQLFEEFGRAFIGRLNPELQEKIAYKNAEDLFEKGLQIPAGFSSKKSLKDFSESSKKCIIEKIGNSIWEEILSGMRQTTDQENQIISQCSQQEIK